MLNVHALGGKRMLEAAKNALENFQRKPKLIAVTILTSLETQDLSEMGFTKSAADQAKQLAQLSFDCGLDGVVCSAEEAKIIREATNQNFCLVTPGIRLIPAQKQDQARVLTPKAALQEGADYLVIGRAITHANHPETVLQQILKELKNI